MAGKLSKHTKDKQQDKIVPRISAVLLAVFKPNTCTCSIYYIHGSKHYWNYHIGMHTSYMRCTQLKYERQKLHVSHVIIKVDEINWIHE